MSIQADFTVISTPEPEVDRIAELIKRLTAKNLVELGRLLADDHMADKLLPILEYEMRERDNPILRINDVPSED
jgi:hypothetical protein|tara:strand:- start:1228 stop:1449 length:222 start_codon:yes stop_codon:yes gene_type:complete